MNNSQIEIVKSKKRLILSGRQILMHYKFAILPLMFFFIFLANLINTNHLFFGFFWGAELWIWLLVSLIIYIKQRKKLSFKEYKGNISKSDTKEALTRTTNELDGLIEHESDFFFQAFIKDPLDKNDGDLITIIKKDNTFIINSIADPRKNSFAFSSSRNKTNIKTYLKHLRDVIDNKPENKEYLIPEKEWTAKKVITRLILYPFFIFVIIMSIKLILEPIHRNSMTAGFFGLLIGAGYIVIDLILIVRKIKNDAQQIYKKNKGKLQN